MNELIDLTGKTGVVTGGSRGVGRATAQGIHKNGGGYRSAVDSPNCHRSAGQRVDTRRTKVPPTS